VEPAQPPSPSQPLQTPWPLIAARLRLAQARRHRLALHIAGPVDWTRQLAELCLEAAAGKGLWLTDRPLDRDHRPLAAGLTLLGQELDYLVYDAQGGFDPDSFGAACGALRGGGLLLLLTPPLDQWPSLPDPQGERITVAPYRAEQLSGRYLRRLARVLAQAEGLIRIQPEESQGWRVWLGGDEGAPATDPTRPPPPLPLAPDLATACRTPDQAAAVAALLKTARGRARRPLVIVSDRGRGKTTALGLAARQLLAEGAHRILVTAPRLAALDPLFHHAAAGLSGAQRHRDRISLGAGELRFLPPDQLVHGEAAQGEAAADLVLVDEAAAIPAPLLERLLISYPRLVFATTVHGYEGTGRGFEIRFQRALERLTPAFRRLELKTPIRWAPDDPLEALVNRALLLDARPAADRDLAGADGDTCDHALLDRDQLAGDEASLSQLFGLLVLAHYQTRPLDLRHLLDGPNLQVQVLRHRGQIAATALVAREGGLSPDLARDVFEGRRRPQGHLLPQTLSAHAGLRDAPGLRWARVIRIAVHPIVQGRGLGRRLMSHIAAQARIDRLDGLGVSFGATPDLLGFWSACGLMPVHLGTRRNAASGAHAAVVLLGLTPAGTALTRQASTRFRRRFPTLLAGPFRHLEPDLAAELLALSQDHLHEGLASPSVMKEGWVTKEGAGDFHANHERALSPPLRMKEVESDFHAMPATNACTEDEPDWEELAAFAYAQRPYEASLASLQALARTWLGPALRQGHCSRDQAIPLILAALQYREGPEAYHLAGANGRGQFITLLRESCARLLSLPAESLSLRANTSRLVNRYTGPASNLSRGRIQIEEVQPLNR